MAILTFEQPLNELVRLNLRLEYLFQKLDQNIDYSDSWSRRASIEATAQIIHVLDRPDIKSKYSKALQKQIDQLSPYLNQSGADQEALNNTLNELKDLLNYFSLSNDKIASSLRGNSFLSTLRQHLLYPGGEANFEVPAFDYWLHLSEEKQTQYLATWSQELKLVKQTISTMLKLLRNRTHVNYVSAIQGFHQEPLERGSNTQLIKIKVNQDEHVYPVISASKHRLIIRFYDGDHLISQEQTQKDVQFDLICCY
jgi:cell division protein ZapD